MNLYLIETTLLFNIIIVCSKEYKPINNKPIFKVAACGCVAYAHLIDLLIKINCFHVHIFNTPNMVLSKFFTILRYFTMYVNHFKCLILILNILHLVFCYSMLDSVPVPTFSICSSKWSLLTGKIWTCGLKNVAFGLTLQGVL